MSKFEEFCDVNGKQVREMCRQKGTTVSKIAPELGICVTSLYGYLDRGRMPCRMAHQMMDVIWDGMPPFYFDMPQTQEVYGKHSKRMKKLPDFYANLTEARRQIDIAMQKMEAME